MFNVKLSLWGISGQQRPRSAYPSMHSDQGLCLQNCWMLYFDDWQRLLLECATSLDDQGPVVQSTVSLTSSVVVKMLTVLVSTISNSQVFLLKKCE